MYFFGDADITQALRFPIETLVDERGIYLEKSMLLAALLSRGGFAAAIFLSHVGFHAAVGIRVPLSYEGTITYDGENSSYVCIETTEKTYVADCTCAEDDKFQTIILVGNVVKEYLSMDKIDIILSCKHRLINNIKGADEQTEKLKCDWKKYRNNSESLEKRLYDLEIEMAKVQGDYFGRFYSEF